MSALGGNRFRTHSTSYRAEKGKTGRMLAVIGAASGDSN